MNPGTPATTRQGFPLQIEAPIFQTITACRKAISGLDFPQIGRAESRDAIGFQISAPGLLFSAHEEGHRTMITKFLLIMLLCLSFASFVARAQDIQTKGSISGTVVDINGAVVQNAKVTVSGEKTVDRVATTNYDGIFEVDNLTPGSYRVKADQTGFKATAVSEVEVFVGKTTALKLTLEAGNISEVVEITVGAAAVDQSSTAVGANLNDQLFHNIPVQRGVTGLFYLAPGTTDSLGGGVANPSVSGGSPLDNLYIADGVNITDSAFGGLGVFSREYGTLGVGITTSYVKEVQVKTGGFEPQFGRTHGGIVNIITKSGSNDYHGSVFGYAHPQAFEAARRQQDDFSVNKEGKI